MPDIEYLSQADTVSMADEWFDIANTEHFWMQWRFIEIQKLIRSYSTQINPILEIGCGNGVVLQQFEKLGYEIDGCDLNEIALSKANVKSASIFVYNIFDESPQLIEKYKTTLLLDVVEHIDDDLAFLKQSVKHIQTGGYVILNVPALPFLFSKYDEIAGHVRRYTKKDLSQLLQHANLEILQINYWGFSLLPIALIRKMMLRFVSNEKVIASGFDPSPVSDFILRILLKIETILPFHFPIGTSLLAICRKK